MPRRRVAAKRDVIPDPKFSNIKLAKFMNHVMVSGKKSVAERIVYGALEIVEKKLNKDPVSVFEEALESVAPLVEVKSRRVGGATYQVPVEVRPSRRIALAMRWLVDYARSRGDHARRVLSLEFEVPGIDLGEDREQEGLSPMQFLCFDEGR